MPASIANPEMIDLITFDQTSGEYALIIATAGPWEESEEEKARLLQKINNYLRFIIDGDLAAYYPHSYGRPIRIQIDSSAVTPPTIGLLINQAVEVLLQHGIRLCINRLADK